MSESDVSNVINDLGDAKQLAQPKDPDRFGGFEAGKEILFSHAGTSFQHSNGQLVPEGRFLDTSDPEFKQHDLRTKGRDSHKNARQKLGRQIRAALQESSWENKCKDFLPMDQLELIITRTAVLEELQWNEKEITLVSAILDKKLTSSNAETTRRKIFAILVLINRVASIEDFIAGGIYDSDLPLDIRKGVGDREGCFDVYRMSTKPDEENTGTKIRFFESWEETDVESFKTNQWRLLAPWFSLVPDKNGSWFHYDLKIDTVLPFIQDVPVDAPETQYGGTSEVRHVKIHRAHQNLFRVCQTPLKVVLESPKELNANNYLFQHRITTWAILPLPSKD